MPVDLRGMGVNARCIVLMLAGLMQMEQRSDEAREQEHARRQDGCHPIHGPPIVP